MSLLIAERFLNRLNCFHESDPQIAVTFQRVRYCSSTQEKGTGGTCKGLLREVIRLWTISTHPASISKRPALGTTLIKARWTQSPGFPSLLLNQELSYTRCLSPRSAAHYRSSGKIIQNQVWRGNGGERVCLLLIWPRGSCSGKQRAPPWSWHSEPQAAREGTWV